MKEFEAVVNSVCKPGAMHIDYKVLAKEIVNLSTCSKSISRFSIDDWSDSTKGKFIIIIAKVSALWSLLQLRTKREKDNKGVAEFKPSL